MWLLVTIILSTLPILMLIIGKNFMRVQPRRKNCKIYYRTQRSMRDERATRFAHQFCGKFYWCMGKWMLLITVVLGIIFLRLPIAIYETTCGVWLMIESIVLLVAVPMTEKALAYKFGTDYGY